VERTLEQHYIQWRSWLTDALREDEMATLEVVTDKVGPAVKFVYSFGAGRAEGNGKMKAELGGKGAGLAEMTNAGLPVPPGFTIQTEACRRFLKNEVTPIEVEREMRAALNALEELTGQRLGDPHNPLLLSVRSGSKFSMPGMMDTILNLGLNDETVEALGKLTANPVFAYDCYHRFIQMFSTVVLGIPREKFVEVEQQEQAVTYSDREQMLDAMK